MNYIIKEPKQRGLYCAFIDGMMLMAQGFKKSACNAGDSGPAPRLERSPGGGNGNPLQYSFLENFMDRGAWWATVHGVPKSQTRLSMCWMAGR